MKNPIKTHYTCPPIPIRNQDWHAQFTWQDGDDDLHGAGETEERAVLDLLVNASEADNDGAEQKELVDMAFAWWKGQMEQKK